MEIGDRIRAKRNELGMSQLELAKKLGYKSKSTINKIEMGTREIRQKMIKDIADALDTTPGYIMGWEEEKIKATQDKPGGLDQTEYDKLTSAHKAVVNSLIHQLLASQSEK